MWLADYISRSPFLLRWLGIFAVLGCGYFGFISWRELQELPEAPQQMNLAEASLLVSQQKTTWAIINDIQWDCNHIYYYKVDSKTNTDIVFTNKSKDIWGYAFFSREITCNEVMQEKAVGILNYANDRERANLISNSFDVSQYEKNSKFLSLCTSCGRGNSQTGVILYLIMVILGVLLIGISNRPKKKNRLSSNKMYTSNRNRA